MRAEWRLVGRDQELHTVRNTLVRRRQGMVLAGPAGVGKSRLAAEALELCRKAGFAVERVTATRSSSEIPLGAFAPLLAIAPQPGQGNLGEKAQLLHRCADELLARADGRPLVLGVDDAHLLDDMSATLVHQLVESHETIVLATVRNSESCPDPVVALWKGGLSQRIDLTGLDTASVTEVLADALGAPVDEAAVEELMTRCRGNMLFLRELAGGAVAGGVLRNEGGLWRLVGELHATDRLVELVENRLAGLTTQERELLEIVAFGEPLGPAELSLLGDMAVAESLERKALLKSSQEGLRLVVRLGHPVYGDVLRERLPALKARTIARSLAEAVEASGARRREDLLRIATWRLVGGGADPGFMYEAALAARWRYDFALAERLAEASVEVGGGFESRLLAAQLAGFQGRPERTDAELAELAATVADEGQAALVALIRLDNRVIYAGTIDEGLEIAERAEVGLGASEQRDEIAARRAALLLAKEGPSRAFAALQPILDGADGRALVWACMPGSYSLARLGRIDEALEVARRGFRTHLELTNPTDWYPWMHAFYEAEALAHAGRIDEAERLATDQYWEGVRTRSLEAQAMFSWHLSKTVADRGHVDEAIRHGQKAISIYRQLGRPQFVDFCLIYQVQALAMGARPDEAEATLRSLEQLGIERSFFMGIDLVLAQGWVTVARGNVREARETFLHAAAEGERIGDLVGAMSALHSVARVGYAKDVVAPMAALADRVEGVLAAARHRHARALAETDAEGLAAVSAEFEEMGALLLAAEAAADSAVAWDHHGDQRRKASAQQRTGWLSERCAGARTPALRATESRARLTPAEWEAAQLAAVGRSNRDIAAQLVVSVRTVENRLQHVYGKLGVRGRSALAEALETIADPTGRGVSPTPDAPAPRG
ncbi:MAG TPA: AAA family ATPase [Pseudonocardia sp.]|nr:AAA family ATPase [Pseudonocardia sp.]